MTDSPEPSADPRRGIQSLEVGLAILKSLARLPGPATLKEIANEAGFSPSNCHRYLVSFARMGFVGQDDRSSRYFLGPAVLDLGLAAMARIDELGVANEVLQDLVEETGHTGMTTIWADAGPTIVRWLQGREAVRTTLAAGSILPAGVTASGRMFLSFLPRHLTDGLVPSTQNGELDENIRRDREVGWAQVAGDHIPGLYAAAAPVLNSAGHAVAVLTIVRAGQPFSEQAITALRSHSEQASRRLGWYARK